MTLEEEKERQVDIKHMYEMGIMVGARQFNWVNFVQGAAIGFAVGVLAILLTNS
jgi:hypothetical protein